jgi:hypothetical protein
MKRKISPDNRKTILFWIAKSRLDDIIYETCRMRKFILHFLTEQWRSEVGAVLPETALTLGRCFFTPLMAERFQTRCKATVLHGRLRERGAGCVAS